MNTGWLSKLMMRPAFASFRRILLEKRFMYGPRINIHVCGNKEIKGKCRLQRPKRRCLRLSASVAMSRRGTFAAIKIIGGDLKVALDPKDSVGVIDSYFPDADFLSSLSGSTAMWTSCAAAA